MVTGAFSPAGARSEGHDAIAEASEAHEASMARFSGKESNWVPTDPKREFELMARFYAPKKEFFDKVWKLPDVEEVK